MKTIGIIAEYNPFHLGHLYQINKVKELYPNSLIIALITPSITQRGEISILNKWDKTSIILDYGVDLVIEMPTVYSFQAADIFAYGAINILNNLKIDTLVFGTEEENIQNIMRAATIQKDEIFNTKCGEYLKKGYNYPTALNMALNDIAQINIKSPNDLLALAYIKAINKINPIISYINIKRNNSYHGEDVINNITSATNIRNMWNKGLGISKYIPKYNQDKIYHIDINNYFKLLKYQIYNNYNNLNIFLDVDEGIENRIKKFIDNVNNLDELILKIKTKRYTYNKIQRMLTHIVFNYNKNFNSNISNDYIRVLGFNKNGNNYLHDIKKKIDIPIITGYKKNVSIMLDYELLVTKIYSLIVGKKLIENEFNSKPIIK